MPWQYLGPWGWKNIEPEANAQLMAARAEGAELKRITHVWLHHKNGIQREDYVVDLYRLTQLSLQGRWTERQIRLVAFWVGGGLT